MDRERLKEVKQTDLTESRVNEEFVDWLKNKAPSWLLAIMLAACGYLAIVNWRQSRDRHAAEGWSALAQARLPATYEQIAIDYADVDSLAILARLRAGQRLLNAVQTETPFDAQPGDGATLSEEDRQSYLARADTQFEQIIDIIGPGESLATVLFAANALEGRAAVAEARGNPDAAQAFYEQSASWIEPFYPDLAGQARLRAENVVEMTATVNLPSEADLVATDVTPVTRQPAIIEPPLEDLLLPPDDAPAG